MFYLYRQDKRKEILHITERNIVCTIHQCLSKWTNQLLTYGWWGGEESARNSWLPSKEVEGFYMKKGSVRTGIMAAGENYGNEVDGPFWKKTIWGYVLQRGKRWLGTDSLKNLHILLSSFSISVKSLDGPENVKT